MRWDSVGTREGTTRGSILPQRSWLGYPSDHVCRLDAGGLISTQWPDLTARLWRLLVLPLVAATASVGALLAALCVWRCGPAKCAGRQRDVTLKVSLQPVVEGGKPGAARDSKPV